MRKRGQVTVFIIIGILILGIVLGMVYLSKYLVKEKAGVNEEEARGATLVKDSVKMFVEGCLEKVGEEGIFYIGWQGGHYNADYRYVNFSSILIPYFYHLGEYYLPDKAVIEEELSSYVLEHLDECTNNFTIFKEREIGIKEGDMTIKSKIVSRKILLDVYYPIEIQKAGAKTTLSGFLSSIELDFNEIYNQISASLEEQKEAPNAIPLGGVTHLAYIHDFAFEVDNLANDTVVYFFLFNNTLEEEPYVFIYAAKYDWAEEVEEEFVDEELERELEALEELV